jgi:hypothetical protein
MTPTRNPETLERQYRRKGVEVTKTASTADRYLIAEGFRCCACGTAWSPDAGLVRNRHVCPNKCNAPSRAKGVDVATAADNQPPHRSEEPDLTLEAAEGMAGFATNTAEEI